MKRIIAYQALLYGLPYIQSSIRSVIDAVSEFHILYTDKPSHGSSTSLPCPDTEDELRAIAEQAAGGKLRWHKGQWQQENEQRNSIESYAPDADVVIICDSDELFNENTLKLLEEEIDYPGAYITIPMWHFYHNFRHAMIHDLAAPPRILFPKSQRRDLILHASQHYSISHFGYAQPIEYLRYKLSCHGHKHELRFTPDEYVAMYLDRNRWTDVHPVGHQWAIAEEIEPLQYMPEYMQSHPYFNLEWIE